MAEEIKVRPEFVLRELPVEVPALLQGCSSGNINAHIDTSVAEGLLHQHVDDAPPAQE